MILREEREDHENPSARREEERSPKQKYIWPYIYMRIIYLEYRKLNDRVLFLC